MGGGAAGLVSLRNFIERGQFEKVELVERRDDVGGIWWVTVPLDVFVSPQRLFKGIWEMLTIRQGPNGPHQHTLGL
jgi:cation diffusion facilitator CzcD-associated flavoprotein CzcO